MLTFKKISAALVAMACIFSVAGCSKKTDETTKAKSTTTKSENVSKETDKIADNGGADASEETHPETEVKEDKLIFYVSPEFELKQDAWLGVVPAGKDYKKEVDADEVDIYYVYVANSEKKASDKYCFEYLLEDIAGLDDGNYSIVLCDTDDDTGKVLLQFPVEIKGKDLKPDFSKIKVN